MVQPIVMVTVHVHYSYCFFIKELYVSDVKVVMLGKHVRRVYPLGPDAFETIFNQLRMARETSKATAFCFVQFLNICKTIFDCGLRFFFQKLISVCIDENPATLTRVYPALLL